MKQALADAMARAIALLNDAGWVVLNDPELGGCVRTRLVASSHAPPLGARRVTEAATGHVARNLAVLVLSVGALRRGEAARRAFALLDALCDDKGEPRCDYCAEKILHRLGGDGWCGVRIDATPPWYRGRARRSGDGEVVAWGATYNEALAGLCAQARMDFLAWAALRLALGEDFAATQAASHREDP